MSISTKEMIIERQKANIVKRSSTSSEYDFTFDHPSLQIKRELVEQAAEALKKGETHYVDVPGIMALRKIIADTLQTTGLTSISAANVLVTTGIHESRFLAIQVFSALLGGIAVPSSCDPNVHQILKVRETRSLKTATNRKNFQTLPDEVLRAVQDGYKLVYFENPVRLSGKLLENGQFEEICSILERYDAYAIIDIGFLPWAEIPDHFYSALTNRIQRFVLIGETFPGIGMKGLNTAFITAKEDWVTLLQVQKQVLSICTSAPTQYASIMAGKLYAEKYSDLFETLKSQKNALLSALADARIAAIPGEAANVAVFFDPEEKIYRAFVESGIDLLPGNIFNAKGVTRISISLDDQKNKKIISFLSKFEKQEK
jgi:aspartate aminotransferase